MYQEIRRISKFRDVVTLYRCCECGCKLKKGEFRIISSDIFCECCASKEISFKKAK